jgi:hypothetical protein
MRVVKIENSEYENCYQSVDKKYDLNKVEKHDQKNFLIYGGKL